MIGLLNKAQHVPDDQKKDSGILTGLKHLYLVLHFVIILLRRVFFKGCFLNEPELMIFSAITKKIWEVVNKY